LTIAKVAELLGILLLLLPVLTASYLCLLHFRNVECFAM
jgi:hypothetical protein